MAAALNQQTSVAFLPSKTSASPAIAAAGGRSRPDLSADRRQGRAFAGDICQATNRSARWAEADFTAACSRGCPNSGRPKPISKAPMPYWSRRRSSSSGATDPVTKVFPIRISSRSSSAEPITTRPISGRRSRNARERARIDVSSSADLRNARIPSFCASRFGCGVVGAADGGVEAAQAVSIYSWACAAMRTPAPLGREAACDRHPRPIGATFAAVV